MEEFPVGIAGLVGDGRLDEPDKVLLGPAEGLIVEDAVLDLTGGIITGSGHDSG